MKMTFSQHLRTSHELRELLHTLYPEKLLPQQEAPKKETGKEHKK